jgi:hypothetical protein
MAALRTLMSEVSALLRNHGKQIVTDLSAAFTWAIQGIGHVLDWLDRNGKEVLVRIEAVLLDFQFDFELYVKPVLEWLGQEFVELDRMRDAREAAVRLAWTLKTEIFSVADALRQRRTLSQSEIDTAMHAPLKRASCLGA